MGTPVTDSYGAYAPQINSASVGGKYTTETIAGIPQFENGKQFTTKAGTIQNFEAFNSSNDEVYVAVYDSEDGDNPDSGDRVLNVTTLPAKGFESMFDDEIEFNRGLYAKAFTDPGLTTPAGDVMSYYAKWTF